MQNNKCKVTAIRSHHFEFGKEESQCLDRALTTQVPRKMPNKCCNISSHTQHNLSRYDPVICSVRQYPLEWSVTSLNSIAVVPGTTRRFESLCRVGFLGFLGTRCTSIFVRETLGRWCWIHVMSRQMARSACYRSCVTVLLILGIWHFLQDKGDIMHDLVDRNLYAGWGIMSTRLIDDWFRYSDTK